MKTPIVSLIAAAISLGPLPAQSANPQQEPPKETCLISGQVLNAATGEPLRKATASLIRLDKQPAFPFAIEVDSAGRFLFDNLDPGKYSLYVFKNGFTTQYYGAKRPGSRTASPITLAPKQELKGITVSLAPQGVIAGRVIDQDGEPMASVVVTANRLEWHGDQRQLVPYGNGQFGTNDLGEYRIYALPEGSYVLQATRQSRYNPNMVNPRSPAKPDEDYVTTYYPGTMDLPTSPRIQVKRGVEMGGMDIKMAKAAVVFISGTVAGITSTRPGITSLWLSPSNGGGNGGIEIRHTLMNPKGAFEFRGIPSGPYVLGVSSDAGEDQITSTRTINVTDQPITGLTLTLTPGITITGTVTTEGGESAGQSETDNETANRPGLTAVLLPTEMASVRYARSTNAEVTSSGSFLLKNVQPGHYYFAMYGPACCYLKSARFGSDDVRESPLEIPEGAASGTLELAWSTRCAEVTGIIQDPHEKPMAGATALLIPEENNRAQTNHTIHALADQNGAYVLKNLRPGKYKLIAIESVEAEEWMDPEFRKPYEKDAIELTLQPNQKETRQLMARPPSAEISGNN